VQRSADASTLALAVALVGRGQRIGIDLEDAAQSRAAAIERRDPRDVFLRDRSGGLAARLHPLLKAGNRRFFEIERRGRRLWRRLSVRAEWQQQDRGQEEQFVAEFHVRMVHRLHQRR